jgi:hypothetical protein
MVCLGEFHDRAMMPAQQGEENRFSVCGMKFAVDQRPAIRACWMWLLVGRGEVGAIAERGKSDAGQCERPVLKWVVTPGNGSGRGRAGFGYELL